MYKISFYVPFDACETVKEALFDVGAGTIGQYDRCAWQVAGKGQFRPLTGSEPNIGAQGKLEYVDEFNVEMVCADELIAPTIAALIKAHPYEEPAYQYWLVNAAI